MKNLGNVLVSLTLALLSINCVPRSDKNGADPKPEPSSSGLQPDSPEDSNRRGGPNTVDDREQPAPSSRAPDSSSCLLERGGDFAQKGPFKVTTASSGSVNLYWPHDLPQGCKVPLVSFNNGSLMPCAMYSSISQHLASWGFLVACHTSGRTGKGDVCIESIEELRRKFPAQYNDRLGIAGHSEGGMGSFSCAVLAEQKWGSEVTIAIASIEPDFIERKPGHKADLGMVKSPAFIMSGSDDFLVTEKMVQGGFDLLRNETVWLKAMGASHVIFHSWASTSSTAYFRWKLLGDEKAAQYFRNLTNGNQWKLVKTRP
jgi:hypothetical protein